MENAFLAKKKIWLFKSIAKIVTIFTMHIPFDLSNTTTRVLTSTGCIVGGTVAAALCPPGLAVGLAAAAAGVAGNLLASDLENTVKERLRAGDVLRNHDLQRLTGLAIKLVIENAVEHGTSPELQEQKLAILSFAKRVPKEWGIIMQSPSWQIDLRGADVSSIPGFLIGFDGEANQIKVLETSSWHAALVAMRDIAKQKVNDAALQVLAIALHREYARTVRELLKDDTKAFIALQLMFFKTILDRLPQIAKDSDPKDRTDVLAAVQKLQEWSQITYKKWLQQLDKAAQSRHRKLLASIESSFSELKNRLELLAAGQAELLRVQKEQSDALQRIETTQATIPNQLADELERRKLVQPAFAFQADISRIITYAPTELIGRESETAILEDAWGKVQNGEPKRPHVLAFVALGGEGKTSLVTKWAADLAHRDWPNCDAVFAWSFYHQGTDANSADSSDLFLAEALSFFGDPAMAASSVGAFDKGRRLAELVVKQRALLILDGLEPLQNPPDSPTAGELKDEGIKALLTRLSISNRGLCVVTTRYLIKELRSLAEYTAPQYELKRLSNAAGIDLLRRLGVTIGSFDDFRQLVEDVKGHALTLNLLGAFIAIAYGGDIRKRDLIRFEDADGEIEGGHAFRVIESYVTWLKANINNRPLTAILRIMGLFDRPVDAGCFNAVRQEPAIHGITEPLVNLSPSQLNVSLSRLENTKLIAVTRDMSGNLMSIDSHALVREYFAGSLRRFNVDAWRAAHRRLYEHLCSSTVDKVDPSREELQPLYLAVAHGCKAGMQRDALFNVFRNRIHFGDVHYSWHNLGAYGSELMALASFFDIAWSHLSASLNDDEKAWLQNETACCLRAMGRLTEAIEPMRAALLYYVQNEIWIQAAIVSNNLSELELLLGDVDGALRDATSSVGYADRSGDGYSTFGGRATRADTLYHAGCRTEAEALFLEAEQIHADSHPDYPRHYSLYGFRYCELLLEESERSAWRLIMAYTQKDASRCNLNRYIEFCSLVSDRVTNSLKWTKENFDFGLLSTALDKLMLGRAGLYTSVLEGTVRTYSKQDIDLAVMGLRRAGTSHYMPRGLLTRSIFYAIKGDLTGPESAQSDLDEAWEIAERGPMPLFLADIHLHRARLFFREIKYPWISAKHDLSEARRLIFKHGYLRRKEELEDAEAAILNSNANDLR